MLERKNNPRADATLVVSRKQGHPRNPAAFPSLSHLKDSGQEGTARRGSEKATNWERGEAWLRAASFRGEGGPRPPSPHGHSDLGLENDPAVWASATQQGSFFSPSSFLFKALPPLRSLRMSCGVTAAAWENHCLISRGRADRLQAILPGTSTCSVPCFSFSGGSQCSPSSVFWHRFASGIDRGPLGGASSLRANELNRKVSFSVSYNFRTSVVG